MGLGTIQNTSYKKKHKKENKTQTASRYTP